MADETMPLRVRGLALTERMKDMGIVAMRPHGGLWIATFDSDPGVEHLLPPPVADWLLATVETEARPCAS